MRWHWSAFLCIIQFLACNNSTNEKICVAKTTQFCICPNDEQGIQVCTLDESEWGECQGCSVKQDSGVYHPDADLFGVERHQCYPNHTCDVGLICLSNLCVKQPNSRDASVTDATSKTGAESEFCYPNNSCNAGLTCLSGRCVRLPDLGVRDAVKIDLSYVSRLDMSKPTASKPDAVLLKHDAVLPKPDVTLLKPDVTLLKPDVTLLKPDVTLLKPDVAVAKPDSLPIVNWKVTKFPTMNDVTSVFGNNPNNVWAIGNSGGNVYEFHWDGTSWTSAILPDSKSSAYDQIWVSPTGDRFVGTSGDLFINGYKMQLPDRNDVGLNGLMGCGPSWGAINGIWGTSSTDVFITTDAGRIIHYDGIDIIVMQTPDLVYNSPASQKNWFCPPGYFLKGIWGTDHNNVYAVGGGPFSTVEPGLLPCSEFGNCPIFNKEVSLILHFDGQTWKKVTRTWPIVTPDGRLVSIWGVDKNMVFASGGLIGAGTVLSNKGGTVWQMLSSGTNLNFDSIGGNSTTTWFVGGNEIYGGMMTYDPKTNLWDFPSVPGSVSKAHAIWMNGDSIFLAGWSKEIVSTIPYIEKWTPAVIYYK